MTKDIIINGVSIEELKKQRKAIQQGASKIISDSIEAATKLLHKIMKAESKEDALKLAEEAYEHLDTAEIVSGVSGVQYYLDYNDGYHDDVLSTLLSQEDLDEDEVNPNVEFSYSDKNALYKLYNKLESMESDTEGWNASTC
jgi:uncharacterized lipoprotein YehR (DUF1307 family)